MMNIKSNNLSATDNNEKLVTIGNLADEINVHFRKLQPVFTRLKSRNIALYTNIVSIKEVNDVIKYFSKEKTISLQLYHFVLGQ
ncbi:hypothetical protein F5ESL0230_05595 [Lactobacillus sp. ESL0230]|nr:hypothetical protein F5ESL0230_05595 [Lactobacillus sp. ESL0230]